MGRTSDMMQTPAYKNLLFLNAHLQNRFFFVARNKVLNNYEGDNRLSISRKINKFEFGPYKFSIYSRLYYDN